MKLTTMLLFFPLLTPSLSLWAGVNVKNGNFHRSFTVINSPGGGKDLKIDITFNSKATRKGYFGLGLGSYFETYVKAMPDGSLVVFENGSGARTRFVPQKKIDPRGAAKKIIEKMRKQTTLSDQVARTLLKKLEQNAELRQAYVRKFNVTINPPTGTILYSNVRGPQQMHVLPKGYKRIYSDGKEEFFNKKGQLIKIKDKHGYTVKLSYKKNGLLSKIKDSQAKQIFFEWYSFGKIKSVSTLGGGKTTFEYSKGLLTKMSDVAGNIYKFEYDSNYNMTAIVYKDGTKYKIAYKPKTQFVSQTIDRKNRKTSYKYESDPKNPNLHYWTLVTKKGRNGREATNRYEYEIKTRPDGSQYTYRIFTVINGVKTDTIYSECCSLPLKITRGKLVSTFEYNGRGLLTKKTSSTGDFVQLEYHDTLNKVVRVVDNNGWTNFKYSKRGNLAVANNSGGRSIALRYNRKGQITKMVNRDKKSKTKDVLKFKYNTLGKPVEIAMRKVGKINVDYDNYGGIKKVSSKEGREMTTKVFRSFQSLLAIVKPAGVSLNI